MSKVKYTKCDICGKIIENGFNIKRSLKRKRSKIDICQECFDKIKFLANDIDAENKVIERIIDNNPYKETDKSLIYLHGVEDTLKIMSHYRLNHINIF